MGRRQPTRDFVPGRDFFALPETAEPRRAGRESLRISLGEDYETKVLCLDKSPLRASLLWLKNMSVIDDPDIAEIDRIREHRNELAHDLPKFLAKAEAETNTQLCDQRKDKGKSAEQDGCRIPDVESPQIRVHAPPVVRHASL